MIHPEVEKAINAQIVNELYASNSYLAVASYMEDQGLKILAAFFFNQSDEEREHALRLLHYLLDVNGHVKLSAVPAPNDNYESVEDAVRRSLDQELTVTAQINHLMDIATREGDHASASFLRWFVDEQVEEQATMNDLLLLIRHAGPNNLLLVEDRLIKQGVAIKKPGADEEE
jgi:ferritin